MQSIIHPCHPALPTLPTVPPLPENIHLVRIPILALAVAILDLLKQQLRVTFNLITTHIHTPSLLPNAPDHGTQQHGDAEEALVADDGAVSEAEQAAQRGEQIRAIIVPYQIVLGYAAIVLGLWTIVATFLYRIT